MGLLMVDFSSQPPPLFSFSLSFPASAPPGRSGVGPCSRSLAGMDGGVASAARVRCAPARLALSFLVSSLSSTASVPESWAKIVAIFSVRARMSSRLGGASSMVSVVSSWLWRSTGETVRRSCAGARGAPGTMGRASSATAEAEGGRGPPGTMGRACSATAGAASGIPGTSGRASRATAGGASSALGSPSGSAEISAPPAARSGASAPAPCSGGSAESPGACGDVSASAAPAPATTGSARSAASWASSDARSSAASPCGWLPGSVWAGPSCCILPGSSSTYVEGPSRSGSPAPPVPPRRSACTSASKSL
mmetsp:Transcript_61506/g.159731  ORF Transcript_61506/g.159731 Transcript_61506/m.159731 type:complete len:309 (+) Transcript_61506:219-1145(+)